MSYAANVDQLSASGFGPFPYQVDGDYLGEADNLEIHYETDALNLILPVSG